MEYKYEYTCLNIYSGKWYTTKSNNYYAKGTILQGEYEVIGCVVIKNNSRLFVY